MNKKEDRRTTYTKQTIKQTFLDLLKEKSYLKITVTELCKCCDINRGTFYLHYLDMRDVLDDILSDMTKDMRPALDHVFCAHKNDCTYPFCTKIQESNQYQVLFLDDTISTIILEKIAEKTKEGYVTWLMSHSLLTFEEAEAIFYFQMNGCLSINKQMIANHCWDWHKVQSVIDRFIKAGLEAFFIHDQRD